MKKGGPRPTQQKQKYKNSANAVYLSFPVAGELKRGPALLSPIGTLMVGSGDGRRGACEAHFSGDSIRRTRQQSPPVQTPRRPTSRKRLPGKFPAGSWSGRKIRFRTVRASRL